MMLCPEGSQSVPMSNENLGELFAALAAARLEFGALTKSKQAQIRSDKGNYTYSYAELSDVIEATAAALAKHGLIIIQEPEILNDNGRSMVIISGCIGHKSGAIYALRPLSMPVLGNTAQAIGSAISFGRRYQISAVLNLAAADEDGEHESSDAAAAEAATESKPAAKQPAKAAQRPVTAPKTSSADDVTFDATNAPTKRPVAPATPDEAAIIAKWQSRTEAETWAVSVRNCRDEAHAKALMAASIARNGGKVTHDNYQAVYLDFLRLTEAEAAKVAPVPA